MTRNNLDGNSSAPVIFIYLFFFILNLPLLTVITVPYSYLGMISGLGKYLEGPGKSNNPFVIERVKIPGTHYKISSMDYQAANFWNHRNQVLFTTFVLVLAVMK
jgi:hypothetical protein